MSHLLSDNHYAGAQALAYLMFFAIFAVIIGIAIKSMFRDSRTVGILFVVGLALFSIVFLGIWGR